MTGASHRPTRNPKTTDGTQAMISIAGLIHARRAGEEKWLT